MAYETEKLNISIPAPVREIFDVFSSAGAVAYAVGGAVRDSLLGREVHDWDVASPLRPEVTAELFASRGFKVIPTGIRHGTVTVLSHGMPVEVTAFRIDGSYSDSRHPDRVEFTDRVEEDLARRDFTVNAMAYSPVRGLCDPWNGQADLKAGVIRCVGDPSTRFAEDALRILRAFRFAAQLGFTIDDATRKAAASPERLSAISVERIAAETEKILLSPSPAAYLSEAAKCNVTAHIFPGVSLVDGDFSPLDLLPPDAPLRMGALLRRVGLRDAKTANEALKHLKLSNAFYRRAYAAAITPLPAPEERAVRLFLRETGNADAAIAAAAARGEPDARQVAELSAKISSEGGPVTMRTLAVNGKKLRDAGFPEGKPMGLLLSALLEAVTADPTLNNEQTLLALAADIYGKVGTDTTAKKK